MLRQLSRLSRADSNLGAVRSLLNDSSTLLTEHARRLHTSAAPLSASPSAPGPQPVPGAPAASAAAAGSAAPEAAAAAATASEAGGPQQQRNMPGWAGVPGVAKSLGLAGLIPFIALAPPVVAHIPLMPPELLCNAALLQVGYGATIASFLGGVHWGAAMLDARPAAARFALERYIWGVTPCLMAFPGIMFPGGPGAFVVAATLGVCHVVDNAFWRRGLLPPWYMSLRLPLTTLAITGLGITIGADLLAEQPSPPPADAVQPEADA